MIMIAALLMIAIDRGLLPGSGLSLERANADARYIVVAEVGKIGPRLSLLGDTFCDWTELMPSAVLKGAVTGEELNRNPLSLRATGGEQLPMTGDELIVFIGGANHEFGVTKVLPKTEANLAAIRSASPPPPETKPKAVGRDVYIVGGFAGGGGGIGGTMGLGGKSGGTSHALPDFPKPDLRYRGTTIKPNPKATGEALKLQEEIAALMSLDDPDPGSRIAHFAWFDKDEYMRRYKITRIGWWGGIKSVEPRPKGGWFVKVAIRPWLYIPIRAIMPDYVEETYEYVGGRLRLTSTDAAVAKPELQTIQRH